MNDNTIGIKIVAEATGEREIAQQIEQLKELNQVSSQFEALRRDAGEKFPQEIDKQNRYIKEQLGLLKQIETAGSRERVSRYQDEKQRAWSTKEKTVAEAQILGERREHALAGLEFSEAEIQRRFWAEKAGLGLQPGGGGYADDITDVMMAGRGGIGAMGVMAGGKVFGKARTMLGGLSGGAKIGAGIGVGITGMLGWGLYKFLRGGMSSYQEVSPEFANLMALTNDIPTGRKGQLEFERDVYKIAVGIGEGVSQTIRLEKEWMRLGGIVNMTGSGIEKAVLAGKAFALTPDDTLGYLGIRARAGYLPNMPIGEAGYNVMANMIQVANLAGMPGGRIPEFLQQYETVLPQMLTTAVTVNSDNLLRLIGGFAQMGEPFRGQRGAQVMGTLHGGIAGGGGFAVEAARRILVERGEKATPWALRRQMQEGLNDPANLRTIWGVAMDMAGGNIEKAAFFTSTAFNQPQKLWYNPSKERDSIAELIMGRGVGIGAGVGISDVELKRQYEAFQKTFGFGKQQADVAKEATAMMIASESFGGYVDSFHRAVINFAEKVELMRAGTPKPTAVRTPPIDLGDYDSSQNRENKNTAGIPTKNIPQL